jgi:hypothetical protein
MNAGAGNIRQVQAQSQLASLIRSTWQPVKKAPLFNGLLGAKMPEKVCHASCSRHAAISMLKKICRKPCDV